MALKSLLFPDLGGADGPLPEDLGRGRGGQVSGLVSQLRPQSGGRGGGYQGGILSSRVDPDPNWIRIQLLCGSGSVFRIRIRIHTGQNRIN